MPIRRPAAMGWPDSAQSGRHVVEYTTNDPPTPDGQKGGSRPFGEIGP
jgi:hypothetical protein